MPFSPTSGIGGYVGTPRVKRPYTSQRSRPPDVPHIHLPRSAGPQQNPQGPSRPPDVPNLGVPQAPAQQPAAAPSQAAGQAAQAGAAADGLESYLAGITDPQERAFVAAQIGPKIAALRSQQAALQQQAAQEAQIIQGFTQAILGQLSGLAGAVGGPYAQITGIQKGSGKAEKGEMSKVGKGVNAEVQSVLGAIGAPSSQSKGLAQLESEVFGAGGSVLAGIGGTIPAFATQASGVGALGWAAAQPTLAAAYGTDALRQAMAEIARQQGGINSDLANVTADIPGIRQDYAAGVAKTAQDAEQRATTLYNSGMITQRQYAQALGLPNWQSYPNQAKGSAPRVHYYKDAAGNQWVINEATGKAQRLPGLAKPAVDKPPSQFGGEGIGYFVWQKVGNTWVPKRVIPPKPAAAGATFTQTWQTLPNGNKVLVQRNSKSGAISIVTSLNKGSTPSQPTINGAGGAPMTPTQINEAGIKTASAINVARRKGIPLQVLLDSLERNNIPIQIYMPKIAKAYNIPLKIRDPAKMDVNALYRVATLLGYRPKITATTSYVGVDDLGKQRPFFPGDAKKNAAAVAAIQNKGIAQAQKDGDIPTWVADVAQVTSNRRPAGGRNHDQLVQWVQAHLPKGSDPTDGSTLIAYATQQLGQPYVWGGESRKEGGFDCSGLVDWVMRQEGYTGPRVTTYTLAKMGTSVKGQPLQPGDLIITHNGGHVVMYAGNGKVIAAPHTGSKVQYQPLSNFKQEDVRRLSAAQVPGVAGSTPQAPGAPPVTGNQKGYKPIAGNPDDLQTPKGARGYAFTVASDEGWGGAELKALDNLWYGESKWNYKAKNGSSGALGIPQALGHKLPPDYANNATAQVDWGINYIKNRYRTPSRAWAFWQATVNKNASLAPPDLRSTAAKWIANGWGGY